ncbi:MAG: peptide-methionine (S)-S-oxide reductase MsrA [Clostridia bacterium]|nr:peptide-methionine (S)-S-oxide reductase MsrA [Clostridia bacterium]
MKNAYFAGGCFWCITPFFTRLPGVGQVVSGFSGGDEADPSYEDVKRQKTGHRETVSVEYDPEKVSFDTLLSIFLDNVDPFDGGGQFIDRGRSYTLAVYYQDADELAAARTRLSELERKKGKTPQVALEPFKSFWPAGEEHQYFYLRHPEEFEREMEESGRRNHDGL